MPDIETPRASGLRQARRRRRRRREIGAGTRPARRETRAWHGSQSEPDVHVMFLPEAPALVTTHCRPGRMEAPRGQGENLPGGKACRPELAVSSAGYPYPVHPGPGFAPFSAARSSGTGLALSMAWTSATTSSAANTANGLQSPGCEHLKGQGHRREPRQRPDAGLQAEGSQFRRPVEGRAQGEAGCGPGPGRAHARRQGLDLAKIRAPRFEPDEPTLAGEVNNVDVDMEGAKLAENQLYYCSSSSGSGSTSTSRPSRAAAWADASGGRGAAPGPR